MEIRIACRKSPLAVLQANKFIEVIQKKYGNNYMFIYSQKKLIWDFTHIYI